MIKNIVEKKDPLLARLDDSPFVFYLTGSRFFTPKETNDLTDFDFFVEDSEEVRSFLIKKGFFCQYGAHNYQDDWCIDVFSSYKKTSGVDIKIRKIDIQLIKPAAGIDSKIAIQFLLYKYELIAKTKDKKIHKLLWRAMFNAYLDGNMSGALMKKKG